MTEAQVVALVERLRMISNLAGRKQLVRWETRNLSDDERQRVEARIIELWKK